jgi:DNA-binding GntR family transcriptional regulator
MFLSERQMAGELAMSKTPIRAAVERLEAEGFLAISPQQGIVVRDVSVHELADQFEVRTALEQFVLRRIAGRLTPEQAGRLADNLKGQEACIGKQAGERFVELDANFHVLLCEFQGNREIRRVMEQLREKVHRVIRHAIAQRPARLAETYVEHRAIADAVLAGDAEGAARGMEVHLEYGKQCLLSPRGR